MRKVFSIVSILTVAAVVLQFYFAGMGVFSVPDEGLFGIHGTTGRIVLPVLFILSLLTAALARAGKRTIWLTVIAILLLALQTIIFIITGAIFNVGPESAEIPLAATLTVSLHALNGVAILAVTGIIARRAWVLAWRSAPAAATDADRPDAATANLT
ncbi:DUF6220 domain-containing protein [Microbacterium sp. zg.B48]|uniref:DUF6220 domain-containing protein n=1 Tax=unclassified Microbacterium TaxID=2609290 RepID=UPI00214ADBAD|nr:MULTISPECIES: DUF6220 domain-containing protein [unclassified Microbacterium]MCR2764901.1 DUF6220 domain-containing protein [Microbacterium sp. zg.B48]MCR2808173.1 DUF6220 domain-containing protein [Microbacterium sp. zg.B185]WIM19362.1 DUF6220 domain-containing protein [Microbacterium sp. zg-B185]